MAFFRRLLGGGGSGRPQGGSRGFGGDEGLYYYVRPRDCEEVVRVRVNPNNDLSLIDGDEGETKSGAEQYHVRKMVRGEKCRTIVELELFYDAKRRFTHHTVRDGAVVTEAEYQAWQAQGQP